MIKADLNLLKGAFVDARLPASMDEGWTSDPLPELSKFVCDTIET